MEKTIIEQALDIFRDLKTKNGWSNRALSENLNLNCESGTLSKWLNGSRVPSMAKISPALEILGARLVLPEDSPFSDEHKRLSARVVALEREVALLEKVVAAYEQNGMPRKNFEKSIIAKDNNSINVKIK